MQDASNSLVLRGAEKAQNSWNSNKKQQKQQKKVTEGPPRGETWPDVQHAAAQHSCLSSGGQTERGRNGSCGE